jgi:hypothetical protein
MTDNPVKLEARRLLAEACQHWNVDLPAGHMLLAPFTEASTPWLVALHAIEKALSRTPSPPQDEADVERVARAMYLAKTPTGEWAHEPERLREYWRTVACRFLSAMPLTRPDGEEVELPSRAEVVATLNMLEMSGHPNREWPSRIIRQLWFALTKPTARPDGWDKTLRIDADVERLEQEPVALPKHGEENVPCIHCGQPDEPEFHDYEVCEAAKRAHLSSLPVRSGEVERAFRAGHAAGFDCSDNTSRLQSSHVEDAWEEYRAALTATPPQARETDRG